MKTKKDNEENFKKWERTYENDFHTTIWRYDSRKSMINPYEVEIIYKNDDESDKKNKKSK